VLQKARATGLPGLVSEVLIRRIATAAETIEAMTAEGTSIKIPKAIAPGMSSISSITSKSLFQRLRKTLIDKRWKDN
jgi:hypothetical protein